MNLQELLVKIIRRAEALKLPCLLIGGHAVVLYGISRLTRDFDLMIPDSRLDAWKQLLTTEFNFRLFHSTDAFLQFDSKKLPPMGIMLVDESTWGKLSAKAKNMPLSPEVSVRLPHPMHLVAMKLAALTSPHRRWDNEDWADVVKLIYKQKLSLEDPEFHSIILKYGGKEILKNSKKLYLDSMGKPINQKEGFKLDPVWDIRIPEPDHVLPVSPTQNVSWSQWMKEIEPYVNKMRSEPHLRHTETQRFTL